MSVPSLQSAAVSTPMKENPELSFISKMCTMPKCALFKKIKIVFLPKWYELLCCSIVNTTFNKLVLFDVKLLLKLSQAVYQEGGILIRMEALSR